MKFARQIAPDVFSPPFGFSICCDLIPGRHRLVSLSESWAILLGSWYLYRFSSQGNRLYLTFKQSDCSLLFVFAIPSAYNTTHSDLCLARSLSSLRSLLQGYFVKKVVVLACTHTRYTVHCLDLFSTLHLSLSENFLSGIM